MKSILTLCIISSLAMLAGAKPAISDRAIRIPLERRSRNAPMSARSVTSDQFSSADRVKGLVSYTHKKYEATFAAYERNTGLRHPLDAQSSSTNVSEPARRGNVTLENFQSELWYGSFCIGTPCQMFTGDFDTGSADVWVPDQSCVFTCEGHRKYNASQSSTLRGKKVDPKVIQYGSGTVAVSCVYTDALQLAGYTLYQGFGGASAVSSSFWNSRVPVIGDAFQFPADGIFGLGFRKISTLNVPTPVDNLNKTQLPPKYLSFTLSPTLGQSELIVGDANYTAFKNDTRVRTPVTNEGYWEITLGGISRSGSQVLSSVDQAAVVDTGTTLIMVPTDIANEYFSSIPGADCTDTSRPCTVPCDAINSTTPILTFEGRDFQVCPSIWNLGPDPSRPTRCMTGMAASDEFALVIIGDVFLQNVYSIFDFGEPPAVHFANLTDPVC